MNQNFTDQLQNFTFSSFRAIVDFVPAETSSPTLDIRPADSFCPWILTLKPGMWAEISKNTPGACLFILERKII